MFIPQFLLNKYRNKNWSDFVSSSITSYYKTTLHTLLLCIINIQRSGPRNCIRFLPYPALPFLPSLQSVATGNSKPSRFLQISPRGSQNLTCASRSQTRPDLPCKFNSLCISAYRKCDLPNFKGYIQIIFKENVLNLHLAQSFVLKKITAQISKCSPNNNNFK